MSPEAYPGLRRLLFGGAGLAVLVLAMACHDPAGPPPTLESGVVSFTYSGVQFTAEGRCYWAQGYPAADSSCALALDLGDTIRVRGVRAPGTNRWVHINLELPEDGSCVGADACRIAFDYLSQVGKVRASFRSRDATVVLSEQSERRLAGTFTGWVYQVGADADTLPVTDGVFDVPVER